MVLDIKMCRFDNVPWGFRLVGGADYDYPLTVVKVRPDSKKERNLYAATPTPPRITTAHSPGGCS